MSVASQFWPAGTVYGALLNFRDECDAMATQMTQPPYKAPPQAPVLFVKTANTWSASGASIPVPSRVAEVEVGGTLAMVIGHRAGTIGRAHAAQFVLMNDLSVPHASFFRPPVKFKCLDGFLGIGSLCVSADQLDDPAKHVLLVRINGEARQTVDFSRMVRSARQLLDDVGEFMTLRAGDVLMLGCAAGRPLARAGDHVEISLPGLPALGTLSNTLAGEAP